MSWVLLLIAGVLEVVWLHHLKQSNGFKDLRNSVLSMAAASASFFLLSYALKDISAATAYAMWTGVGAIGTAIVGILVFGEPRHFLRLLSMALIIGGILGLTSSSL